MPVRPLHLQIAQQIRDDIAAGKLKPGDRLPTVNQIAAAWKCSKQPVVRALDALDYEGLVLRYQGKGAFIADPTPQAEPGAVPADGT